jgi:RecB family exonuclease
MFEDTIKLKLAGEYHIPYFSYSQLNTFMQCPYSYWMTYMQDKFTPKGNKYTVLGSILHDIFEAQGKALIFDEELSIGEARKRFNKEFMSLKEDDIKKSYFKDKEDFIAMYQKGIKALENYYEMYSDVKPLYVERQFKRSISKGLPPAKSFIDRIDGDAEDASSWVVTDYKTGGSPKSKAYLNDDFQLALYASQIYAEFGAYPKAVQFVHPVPAKTQTAIHIGDGVYEFTGQRNPVVTFSVADTIIKITDVLAQIVTAVKENKFPKQIDSWNCRMCFHFNECNPFDKSQKGWSEI